ncbi:MAG: class I SAM-dependent methyltransferase [Gemmatimonadota bacterium]
MSDAQGRNAASRDWFRDWFGEEYLAIYPHRDEREAEAAVRLFLEAAPPPHAAPVLDLACGAGRHLRELLAAGVPALGLDLSLELLRQAREASPGARLLRADMRRLPLADGGLGGLTSFFTSFGYFATREEDAVVAGEMRRVLCTGGSFMLDFLNARRVRAELVPEDVNEVRGLRVRQSREIRGDTVLKRIRIDAGPEDTASREFQERVRLYEPDELERLLAARGLETTAKFGDYGGAPFARDAPRLILAGRAT